MEAAALLSHKKADTRINIHAAFNRSKSKVPVGRPLREPDGYKPKERIPYKKCFKPKYGFRMYTEYVRYMKLGSALEELKNLRKSLRKGGNEF